MHTVMNRARHYLHWLLLASAAFGAAASLGQVPSDAVWIDVRSPAEFAEGHLTQAKLIPFNGIEVGVAALDLPTDAPIYLYCAVGGRAEVARLRLRARGYSNVINVGGLDDARKLAGVSEPTR